MLTFLFISEWFMAVGILYLNVKIGRLNTQFVDRLVH